MSKDEVGSEATQFNVSKLNVELILGLHCILPLLESIHMLISIPKRDVYICDFIEAIWMCKFKLYQF